MIRAQFLLDIKPNQTGQIQIQIEIIKGDSWDVEIFRDIPASIDFLPVIFIIIAIIGVVIILRSRNLPD